MYLINIMSADGTIIPLSYAASDYATQSDIVADKMARNKEYGISNQYIITQA